MKKKQVFKAALFLIFVIAGILVFIFKDSIGFTSMLMDRELLKQKVESFGFTAPVVYMMLQIAQVIIAPVPGEVTGFVGGYIFGALKGFIFSTIALAIGSMLNFSIARFIGRGAVKSFIPDNQWKKFNRLFEEEGSLFIFALFIFPGFPKDYFCLFLGVTNMNLWTFILISSLGRIPGTLLLSFQGELLYQGDYILTIVLTAITAIISFLLIVFRKKIYFFWKNRK
ncbi:MAG: hypothetical protein CSA18_00440 [Deltaproteobacteria bacterium]|nr:MAG: hypothetical protein CSA18_00440 [Deltaproteobacteria bacterium]